MTRQEIPTVTTPNPADVHAGATSAQVLAAMRAAFTAVHTAAAELELRPSAVEVHAQLGLVDCSVYFPSNDVPAVDALADRFGLPPALPEAGPGAVFYVRTGLAGLGAGAGSLTIRTVRPGVDLATRAQAERQPAADPEPIVITGELPAVTTTAVAGPVQVTIVPAAAPATPASPVAPVARPELIPANPS